MQGGQRGSKRAPVVRFVCFPFPSTATVIIVIVVMAAATRRLVRMSTTSAEQQRRVVVLGGGIQGASAAYHLGKKGAKVTLVELESVGSAASGKAGGFLAKDWGSGSTAKMHTESFRMHQELAKELGLQTFREIETLSVASGRPSGMGRKNRGTDKASRNSASATEIARSTTMTMPVTPFMPLRAQRLGVSFIATPPS